MHTLQMYWQAHEFYHLTIFSVVQGDKGVGIYVTGHYDVMKFLVAEEVSCAHALTTVSSV